MTGVDGAGAGEGGADTRVRETQPKKPKLSDAASNGAQAQPQGAPPVWSGSAPCVAHRTRCERSRHPEFLTAPPCSLLAAAAVAPRLPVPVMPAALAPRGGGARSTPSSATTGSAGGRAEVLVAPPSRRAQAPVIDSSSEDEVEPVAAAGARLAAGGGAKAVGARAQAPRAAAPVARRASAPAEEREASLDSSAACDGSDEGSDEDVEMAEAPAAAKKRATKAAKGKQLASKAVARTPTTRPGVESAPAGGLGLASEAVRYAAREKDRFPFLSPPLLRDAAGREPAHPLYDPATLQLPNSFPKLRSASGLTTALSPGQEQWWRIKATHFDCILLFKMGKFYEMYEQDAHVGTAVLGIAYMKGEQPHCGFPEKNYEAHAERLARAGHRVVVVEQVETPEMLEKRRKSTGCKDKVVLRQKVALLSQGTLTEGGMLASSPDAAHVVSLCEVPLGDPVHPDATGATAAGEWDPDGTWLGLCVCDAATGRFLVGAFRDDSARSRLRALLAELRPVEALLPRGQLSGATLAALRSAPRPPQERPMPPGERFWSAQKTTEELESAQYFQDDTQGTRTVAGGDANRRGRFACWPAALASLVTAQCAGASPAPAQALSALGGMLSHLRDSLLDRDLVPLGRFSALAEEEAGGGSDGGATGGADQRPATLGGSSAPQRASAWAAQGYVALDAAALEGLEVLENSEGGSQGTLLAALDSCATAPGRRRLRAWLCRPLRCPCAVAQRQLAVAELKSAALADALAAFRKALRSAPDLERAAARLAAAAGGRGRHAAHIVLYEDAARKRLNVLLSALRGAKAVATAVAAFAPLLASLRSPVLARLVTESAREGVEEAGQAKGAARAGELLCARMPAVSEALRGFERAFDWDAAEKEGRVAVQPGCDPSLDAAVKALRSADCALAEWLAAQRRELGGGAEVCYVAAQKDSHLLEVPDRLAARVPSAWHKASTRKGFTRYTCAALDALKAARAAALDTKESALSGVLAALSQRAASHFHVFAQAADAAATLDALASLACASFEMAASGPVCTPLLLPLPDAASAPTFTALQLRHPCAAVMSGIGGASSAFVPNDVALGGPSAAPLLLLTGPNMGGKSTLLRQTCLAALLAHIGADVPAASLTLSPIDALFVRMGARDDLAGGRSTFAVELMEAGAMLRRATRHSLVALDELGRGTATHDGAAIAHAVLYHLAKGPHPRALFSTHYHEMSASARALGTGAVALAHMGCQVSPATASTPEKVTFLYRLVPGACPKSYGVNVARLAGLPAHVLAVAAAKAAELEAQSVDANAPLNAEEMAALQRALQAVHMGDVAGACEAARAALGM